MLRWMCLWYVKMRNFAEVFILIVLCASVFCVSCTSEPKHVDNSSMRSYSLSDKKLLDIISSQNKLFETIERSGRNARAPMTSSDLISQKRRIDSLWKAYFAGESRNAEAYAIYGKYLRKCGDLAGAYAAFKKADSLDSTMASVKHQLAVYESEIAEYKLAYSNFSEAVKLAPNEKFYLRQRAKFLMVAKYRLVKMGFDSEKLDREMLEDYRKTAELSKPNSQERWEYAKAFYSVGNPDWDLALSLWDNIIYSASILLEKQTALANKARVLIELRRDAEAEVILNSIDNEHLASDKALLMRVIDAEKQKNKRQK